MMYFVYGMLIMLAIMILVVMALLKAEHGKTRDIISDLKKQCDQVIAGQRLSVCLNISPASLKVDPEQFEADKEVIRARLMKVFLCSKHSVPDTLAFIILNHSGWDAFIDGETRQNTQKALSRLLTNGDAEAINDFLNLIVDQL